MIKQRIRNFLSPIGKPSLIKLNKFFSMYYVQKIRQDFNYYFIETPKIREYKKNYKSYPELILYRDGIHTIREPTRVYKKVLCNGEGCIATLVLPVGSTVVYPIVYMHGEIPYNSEHKMRTDKAVVVEIEHHDKREYQRFISIADKNEVFPFTYFVGKTVLPEKSLNHDEESVCESGIHFFTTRKAAEDYKF